jgi:general secretion pathway protein G
MKAKHGFTLVEILIVVVILGILAAIVIPQFTQASTEAKQSSLVSDLQTVRSQIELFKVQHNDNLPGWQNSTWLQAMTGYTDQNGNVVAQGAVGAFGPYLQKVPNNPFVDPPADVTVTIGVAAPGTGAGGWYFNSGTGAFNADDTGLCTDQATPHSSL